MNTKRFNCLLVCISVLLIIGLVGPSSLIGRASSTAIAAPVTFSDVATDYWAFSAIRALSDRDIVNGFPDGSFKPENNVTRAEFAKIIGLALGYSPDTSAPQKFPDLASTHWAFGYVATAVSHGLIVGYPDGSFKPERSVTKAEILTVIARTKGWSSSGGDHFTGLPSDHWARQSIEACYQNGVVRNPDPYIVSEGNLFQDDPATRAQTCVFTDRMLSNSEQVTALIQAGQGGVIQLPDGASVSIPADSLVADAKITLRTIPASSVPKPGGLEPVSVGCEVDLGGVALKSPFTVSFPAPTGDEGLLVARFNGEFWEPLGGGLDTTTNRITGQSLANSIFSLVRLKAIQTGFSMEQHSYHVANSMPSQKETFLGWCYGMAATAGYGVFPSYSTPPKPQKASPTLDDLDATWQNYIKGTNAQQISEWGSWSSTLLALQQKRYSLNSSNSEVVLAAFRSISFGQFLYAMSKNHPVVLGLMTDYEIPSPTTITNLLNSLPVLLWNSSNSHAILAYGLQLTPNPTILVYDPNLPDQPQRISFDSITKWIAFGTPFYSPTYGSKTFQFTHFAPSWPPPTVGKPPLPPSPSPTPTSTVNLPGSIAFVKDYNIWLLRLDGSSPQQLINPESSEPIGARDVAISPDRSSVVYTRWINPAYRIYSTPFAGGQSRSLTDDMWLTGQYSPAWSPDGSLIAFTADTSQQGLWLMKSDGSEKRQIVEGSVFDDLSGDDPSWSPDGNTIAFRGQNTLSFYPKIYRVQVDGSNCQAIANSKGFSNPAWSPDGTKFALVGPEIQGELDGRSNIWTMNVDGSNMVNLTKPISGKHGSPSWSPDGRYLAFACDDGFIWVMQADGTNPTKLCQGGKPQWIP